MQVLSELMASRILTSRRRLSCHSFWKASQWKQVCQHNKNPHHITNAVKSYLKRKKQADITKWILQQKYNLNIMEAGKDHLFPRKSPKSFEGSK